MSSEFLCVLPEELSWEQFITLCEERHSLFDSSPLFSESTVAWSPHSSMGSPEPMNSPQSQEPTPLFGSSPLFSESTVAWRPQSLMGSPEPMNSPQSQEPTPLKMSKLPTRVQPHRKCKKYAIIFKYKN